MSKNKDTIVYELGIPVEFDGQDPINSVTLSRPKGSHLKGLSGTIGMKDFLTVLENLIEDQVPDNFMDEVDGADCIELTTKISEFMGMGEDDDDDAEKDNPNISYDPDHKDKPRFAKVKLHYPITWGEDGKIAELEIKRPKGRHLKKVDAALNLGQMLRVAAKITVGDFTPRFFNDMDAIDCMSVVEVVGDFLDSGQKTGKTSSH